MKNLLLPAQREVLAQLACSRVLLAFDFDGTLAPIVAKPDDACMRARTAELFSAVCQAYPCVVISGRSQADVARRLAGAAVKHVVGNHGMEPGAHLEEFAQEATLARTLLAQALTRFPDIEVEDKRYSLALHYRRSQQKPRARAAIYQAVRALPLHMRIVPGKLVMNVIPERAPNKGAALLALRELEQADTALYAGDDITDEDVFQIDQPGRLLSVRVGESRSSAAGYYVRDQHAIDLLLTRLLALRSVRAAS